MLRPSVPRGLGTGGRQQSPQCTDVVQRHALALEPPPRAVVGAAGHRRLPVRRSRRIFSAAVAKQFSLRKKKRNKGVVQSGQAPQLATCLLPPGSASFSTSTPFTAARRGWTLGCRTPCAAAAAGCFPRSPPKCLRHSSEAMNSARRLSRASRRLRSPGEDIVH